MMYGKSKAALSASSFSRPLSNRNFFSMLCSEEVKVMLATSTTQHTGMNYSNFIVLYRCVMILICKSSK